MSVTQTQSKNPASVQQIAIGRYLQDSTAAIFTITLGFKPRYVKVTNEAPGADVEWYEGMSADAGIKRVTAGTKTLLGSNGITVSDKGFTVGLDSDLNKDNEQLNWMAIQ